MERRRESVVSFFFCGLVMFCVITQATGSRTRTASDTKSLNYPLIRPYPASSPVGQFGRKLRQSGLNVEICQWTQDASCQLSPLYARYLLTSSPLPSLTLEEQALLEEADCLSLSRKNACDSRETCEWVVAPNAAYSDQGHCQLAVTDEVLGSCSVSTLFPFVKAYQRCRRQEGGVCNEKYQCRPVKLAEMNQGCGLHGGQVLDTIIGTSASQTEIIALLVERSVELSGLTIPQLPLIVEAASIHGKKRKLLQKSSTSDGILEVDDDGIAVDTPPTERSTLAGADKDDTGSGLNVSPAQEKFSTEQKTEEGTPVSSVASRSPITPCISVPSSPSAERTGVSGSSTGMDEGNVTPLISDDVGGLPSSDTPTLSQTDSYRTRPEVVIINTPLSLQGNIDHLFKIDTSHPVYLSGIMDPLKRLVNLTEMEVGGDGSVNRTLLSVARRLDQIRFHLDSRLNLVSQDLSWNGTDSIWWSLQTSAEQLDLALSGDSIAQQQQQQPAAAAAAATSRVATVLLVVIDEAMNLWKPGQQSSARHMLNDLRRRLEAVRARTPPSVKEESITEPVVAVDNLDKLVTVFVHSYNKSLQDIYPRGGRREFADAYRQSWVRLLLDRNEKWRAISGYIAEEEKEFGDEIVVLMTGMYRVHSPKTSTMHVPLLTILGDIVDDLVGAAVATVSKSRYIVEDLPWELKSEGLAIWQRGPQITSEILSGALASTIEYLEVSPYADTLQGFILAADKVEQLLASVLEMIDSKLHYHPPSRDIAENSAIILTLEAAMNVITGWTDFVMANNSEDQSDREPFGQPSITNFALSLVGCLTLSPDIGSPEAIVNCRDTDRSPCKIRAIHRWNSTEGNLDPSSKIPLCTPTLGEDVLRPLFADLEEEQQSTFVRQVRDLYFVTAYCPYLTPEQCREDGRCTHDTHHDFSCRPSSDFINFFVEDKELAVLAATTSSCASYLNLSVCGNLKSEDSCVTARGCLWTHPSHHQHHHRSSVSTTGTEGMCINDWVEQFRDVSTESQPENGHLMVTGRQCREQKNRRTCRGQSSTDRNKLSYTTQLPKHKARTPSWLAYTLSVIVAIGIGCVLYVICRALGKKTERNGNGSKSKKNKRKKKGDQATVPRGPPPPMFAHSIEGEGHKRDDFSFVMEAFGNEHSFTTASRSRMISLGRIERYTSSTTGDIPEIQPDATGTEEELFSSESEESAESGWTSSDAWSDNDDDDDDEDESSGGEGTK